MLKLRRAWRELFYIARKMSVWGALLQMLCLVELKIASRLKRRYSPRLHNAKNEWVQRFLRREFSTFIDDWNAQVLRIPTEVRESDVAPIWICWLQGEEYAPRRVANLIANVRRHAGGHPVKVVNRESILSAVELPAEVVGGLDRGDLRLQTFTDVARVWLLERYGGVWVDASVLLVSPIPECVFEEDMWTAKGIELCFPSAPGLVDIAVWQSYFVGSGRHGLTISFMRDFMAEYFSRYSGMIDYVLINHVAKIARDCIPAIASLADRVPRNNELCESLSQYMLKGGGASEEARRLYLEGDTFFYKLSWRDHYPFEGPDGRPTFAGKYLRDLL